MMSIWPDSNSWLQLSFFLGVLLLCVKPMGSYIAAVYDRKQVFTELALGWMERAFYKISGINPEEEMDWKRYTLSILFFSFVCFLGLYTLLRLQNILPYNPEARISITPSLAFNVAVSFVTNTNWQSYTGETTLSPLIQMIGLTTQNFLSPAVGMAVLAALTRGFIRKKSESIGNFWVDLIRGTLYILLPLALLLSLALSSQGVVQTFSRAVEAHTLEGQSQMIAVGPVASQTAIQQLGTNGGGFFGANAAHPFENPTPLSNFLQLLAILLIPASLCYAFGRTVGDTRQGWVLLTAMMIVFIPLLLLGIFSEQGGNPRFLPMGVDQRVTTTQAGGNMEGKEVRFGILNSALWTTATTAAANGSTNASLDSFTPLGGMVPMVFIQFGEVIFGGAGSGLCGMLIFVIVSVFIAGLMVGRTPEYLGKKIGVFEMKMAALIVLIPHLIVLIGTALAVSLGVGKIGAVNFGPHEFSEILYAFASAANNNGSAFSGLDSNTDFYNISLGLAMLLGRYLIMIAVLAIAGSMAKKNTTPNSAGTLSTTTPLFVVILVCIVVTVGVLTSVPALALGPIAEHLNWIAGVAS